MRTRLSVCLRKATYTTAEEALVAAGKSGLDLRPYRCDRCRRIHLTSRTKGKRVPRPANPVDVTPAEAGARAASADYGRVGASPSRG